MRLKAVYTSVLLCLAVAASTSCGDNPAAPGNGGNGGALDVSGLWDYVLNVTVANGDCIGEEFEDNDNPESDSALFIQVGSNVSALAFWGSDDGLLHELVGTRTGDVITIIGSYPEEGGTTTRRLILTVNSDGTSMAGFEEWDWSDGVEDCPDGEAIVTASRQ